jgi:vacuolar-type H+-ATPase subunit H
LEPKPEPYYRREALSRRRCSLGGGPVLARPARGALYHRRVSENREPSPLAHRGADERPPTRGAAAADRVSAILTAAEETAEKLLADTEGRVHERIAEAARAAQNRVAAAELEASELMESARQEAARLREGASAEADKMLAAASSEALSTVSRAQENAERMRTEAEQTKAAATTEGLTIVARAEESAERIVTEARAAADATNAEAQERSRALLRETRTTASDIRTEGLEIVSNLHEMGDSLRSNAERLLRDVQSIHSRMVAQLDREEAGLRRGSPAAGRRGADSGDRTSSQAGEGALEVPEFIPPG